MALTTTKAIVIHTLKFSDSSLIVKCYTKEYGLISFLVRGVLKPRRKGLKAGYFQPLTQLSIVFNHQKNKQLHSIKEAHVQFPYQSIFKDVKKQSIVMFLSEILNRVIQEEEQNMDFYEFLEASFLWLDVHDKVSNFHLFFLLNLTKFLGFYPDQNQSDFNAFNLEEGCFTNSVIGNYIIRGKELFLFKKLLGIKFDDINEISYSGKDRRDSLQLLLMYFQLHLNNFKTPKSLAILETIFS